MPNIIDVTYARSGESTKTNQYGMREMQEKAYSSRESKYLLIKAPPASGKSRALMFIALDKLEHQGLFLLFFPYKFDIIMLFSLS